MFGKKSMKLGFKPKIRTLDEINQDYNHHAAQAGHKTRIIREIQSEVDGHLMRLSEMNVEAKRCPVAEGTRTGDGSDTQCPERSPAGRMSFMRWFRRNKAPANTERTSRATIVDQMNEPRPLPMGQKEFTEWTDRIISGALIPCTDRDSLVKTLASMLMQLGQTESHKPDAFFIHALRKAAVNQVAHANFEEIQTRQRKKFEAEQAKAPPV